MKRYLAFAMLLEVVLASTASVRADEVIDLGSRRELFVDGVMIARLDGTSLRLHEPRREDIAVHFDKPWEGGFSAYITVLKDGERYRMYYRGSPVAGQDGRSGEVTCYAESTDGITWTKPDLGLFEVRGTRANNVILADAPPFSHNFSPFVDTRPGVPASQRYKALAGTSKSGLVAFISADGLRWHKWRDEPVITKGAFDSQNVAFWSESEQCYCCYFRTFKTLGKERYRWISRTTSADFVHWTEPVEMSFGDAPPEQLYTNATQPYFRAPHIYIALPKRWFPGKVALSPEEAGALVENPGYRGSSSDSVFMTTRRGARYDRTFLEAFIRPGPSPRDWISRDNMPAWGVVPAGPRELFLYRLSHYAQPTAHVARYTLRLDGFVSVNAPYQGGEMITKPIRFAERELEINYATSAAGSVRVEIQDTGGKPIPGYSLAECTEIVGDQIERVVAWKGGSDVSQVAGQTIRLRFVLKDADLYALRFR